MRKYSYKENVYRQNHFLKRLKRVGLVFALVVILAVAAIVIDQMLEKEKQVTVDSPVTTSVRNTDIEVFRTKIFQFQAPQEWVLLNERTTENVFYYQAYRDDIIEKEMVIYINELPQRTKVTRVVPVEVTNGGSFVTSQISSHCDSDLPENANRNPKYMTIEGIEVFCDIDSALFVAIAGEKGGDTAIDMIRPDGEKIKVQIEYRDLTSRPQTDAFQRILDTFQLR